MTTTLWAISQVPPGYTLGSYGALLVSRLQAAFRAQHVQFELSGKEGDTTRAVMMESAGISTCLFDEVYDFCRGFAAAHGVS